jgi:hypothetical protein
MEILSIHNNELTTKLENIGSTSEVSLVEILEIIVIEICSNEVAKENEQLRQEVARLGKALYDMKGKGKAKQIQPSQDNTTTGVKRPLEGETVICRLCHKEGHKS